MAQDLNVILTRTEKRIAFSGRCFSGVRFTKVDLAEAVFNDADLEGTTFALADLYGADFCHANLRPATFCLCDLHGVDLTDACLAGTTFRGCLGLSPAMCVYIRTHGGVVLYDPTRQACPRAACIVCASAPRKEPRCYDSST